VFDGRPVEPVYLVTGAVLWLLVCRLPILTDNSDLRSLIVAGIITAYIWLTAFEFWRGRSEPLVSRWPAIIMFFANGALFLLRTPIIALLPSASGSDGVFGSVWMTVLSFEALLLTISSAFLLLTMAKERTELRHRTAAMVDPLTGIANRRSFLQDASCSQRCTSPTRAQPRSSSSISIISNRSTIASVMRSAIVCWKYSARRHASRSAGLTSLDGTWAQPRRGRIARNDRRP
jgi:hypothetical protein